MRDPAALDAIQRDTANIGFTMTSDRPTSELLRTLAASKPGGRILELGTGTGVGTAWILDGMGAGATLTSVDTDAAAQAIARRHLGGDARARFLLQDGGAFLGGSDLKFDLIYADAWPGKFTHLDAALAHLASGGIYFIDDLLPQPNWPDGHGSKVDALVADLQSRSGVATTRLDWSTGLMIVVRVWHDVG